MARNKKLGKGEAEAIVLCKEQKAFAMLTSDRYAAIKANDYGIKVVNMADVIKMSYHARILTTTEALELVNRFIDQNILDTQYIRDLREGARGWLQQPK